MIGLWTHAQRSCVFNFEGVECVYRILHCDKSQARKVWNSRIMCVLRLIIIIDY